MPKLTDQIVKELSSIADDDLLYVVDVSDSTGSADGTSAKIKKSNITFPLPDGSVTTDKMQDGAVNSAKIADSSVEPAKIADNAVTIDKLPAGATGEAFLKGDGTWAEVGGGGGDYRQLKTFPNNYHCFYNNSGYRGTNHNMTANHMYAFPFILTQEVTVDMFALHANTATGSASVGIYDNDDATDLPDNRLVYGAVALSSTGQKNISVADTPLEAGEVYWMAISTNGTPQLKAWHYYYSNSCSMLGRSTLENNISCIRKNTGTYILPETAGTGFAAYYNQYQPMIFARII